MTKIGHIMDNKVKIDFFLPFLKGQKNLHILDIGCRNGLLLSNIFNTIPTKISKLSGVDNDEDLDLDTDDFISRHNYHDENPQLTKELVELRHQDGFTFLDELKIEQDLIIFRNFLHLFPWDKSIELTKNALNKLTPNGIIFVKARSKKKPFTTEEQSYPFDMDTIEEIKSFSKVLAFEEDDMYYNLILQRQTLRKT